MSDFFIENVVKKYDGTTALDSVSLNIKDGELVAVLGASGCGKTTLLRILAGFEEIDSGLVKSGGKVFSSDSVHVSPEKRNIGVVFQSYALWPHMSVAENVGYPLKIKGIKGEELAQAVEDALSSTGLYGMGNRNPAELSGGQRQRVALARCLVMAPDVVLLDEPLANLDVHLRESMLVEFKAFQEKTKATMLFVTHDQSEAMAIADRIAVMDKGRIVQFSTPQELYDCPATPDVARFIGKGCVVPVNIDTVKNGDCGISLDGCSFTVRHCDDVVAGKGYCALKSEWICAGEEGISCTVVRSIYTGGQTCLEVRLDCMGGEQDCLRVSMPGFKKVFPGEHISITIDDGWVFNN
jgi:iron(III) transport system ATP-binding protein